jgi:hypothetical protein
VNLFLSPRRRQRPPLTLAKAHPPFVGPAGGRWADAAHTQTWRPSFDGDEPVVRVRELLRGNLGVPRIEMPQIPGALLPEFLAQLQTRGIDVHGATVPVSSLKATQNELHAEQIKAAVARGEVAHLLTPVIVSNDGFLLDGHHRWAALCVMSPANEINAVVVALPIRALLNEAGKFSGVEHRKSATNEAIDLLKAAMMSWLGNEDAPRRNPQSVASGFADEMEMTVRGKRRRKRKERNTRRAKDEFLEMSPRSEGRKEPAFAGTDNVGDLRDGARDSREAKIRAANNERERRSRERPLVDHMRAMRIKDGS